MPTLHWAHNWPGFLSGPSVWLFLLLCGGGVLLLHALFLPRWRKRGHSTTLLRPADADKDLDHQDVPDFLKQAGSSYSPAASHSSYVPHLGEYVPAEKISQKSAVDDRNAGWRPLYLYLDDRKFTQWRADDMGTLVGEETCPLAIKLFISHRWQTPDDPDPNYKVIPTLVEYLSRIYMAANGFLDRNSYLAKELVAGEDLMRAFQERSLRCCTCGSAGWLDLRGLLSPGDKFYECVDDIHRRRNFYRLLKHVRVWYDFTSLPQARTTSIEMAAFDLAFSRLAKIVSQSDVLALWGQESISRAWCVFEVLAGKTVHFCAPAQADFDPQLKSMFRAHGFPELAHYRGRSSMSIMIHVNGFREAVTGKSVHEIEAYLRDRGLECTEEKDFSRVAYLVHEHLRAQ